MGLLDPFWNAVDTTIAGVGSTVGGAIGGVGDGITATGRNVGDGIASAAGGYGSYVNDTANYVRDATGAGGVRAGSASNPLGLQQSKDAARTGGMPKYSAPKKTEAIAAPAKSGTRSLASQNKALEARERAIASAKARVAGGTVTGRPAAKGTPAGGAGGAKKPTGTVTGKPAAGKKTGGKVTGRAEAAKGVTGGGAKKSTGTVTGKPAAKK